MNTAPDTTLLQQGKQLDESSPELDRFLRQLSRSADDNAVDRVISLYKKEITKLEREIWQQVPSHEDTERYQNAFVVLEKLHELKTSDTRYDFKIVIPVADRPLHLKHCLDSLFQLCKRYGYGGFKNNCYHKVSVLVADDSKVPANIEQHREYCSELTSKGISSEYFGLEEQLELVRSTSAEHAGLAHIISSTEEITDTADFSHKGASIMRNITYLKLNQLLGHGEQRNNTLIYFIDSDQEFCINSTHSDDTYFAINYFHYLDEIFSTQDVSILTGKVVGDPPVSPSVMAANFQQDVYNFLRAIDSAKPERPCQFHQHGTGCRDDAAYHDMADLFGFSCHEKAFDYHCTLQGEHDNADCFHDFANKLERFFYGEHPTRKTFFDYGKGFSATTPARTVYTGNYVIRTQSLEHFIPFATLKLRMAGPVLGRILKHDIQDKFVSANLPMLHNRTVEATGQSEFRAGVKNSRQSIDLGKEFIRQFYGDVMLFSMKKITEQGFDDEMLNPDMIQSVLDATYIDIRKNYIDKHNTVLQLREKIEKRLHDNSHWWNSESTSNEETAYAVDHFDRFLKNIRSNFDEDSFAYQQITSTSKAQEYLKNIFEAILLYKEDMSNWKKVLKP
jgi:hypothetical protein